MRLAGTLSQETLEAHRHKHLAYILNEQTQLNNGNNTTLNTNLNKVSHCSLHKLSILKYQLLIFFFFEDWEVCVCPFFLHFYSMTNNLSRVCICSGGEETVPTQEVHPELPAVWGRWVRNLEIQEHKADRARGSPAGGHRTHCWALPLFGPTSLQHCEWFVLL